MSYDDLFILFNVCVMPFWALLILLPQARVTQLLVHSALIPVVLGVAYMTFIAIAAGSGGAAGDFSLEGQMAGFTLPAVFLEGWVHYLVLDLFVGAWAARDARRNGISRWVVVPVLILTWMAGPVGLLLYMIVKGVTKQRWELDKEYAPGTP